MTVNWITNTLVQVHGNLCLFFQFSSSFFVADKINGLPVMVFVHGESYEWNSGNPYDGSVLAAYGQVSIFINIF